MKYTLTSLSLIAFSSFSMAVEKCGTECHKDVTTVATKTECTVGHCDDKLVAATSATVVNKTECKAGQCDDELTTVATKTECKAGHCDDELATVATKTECKAGHCDDELASASATYLVSGMTCTSCSDKVKTTLTAVDGVKVNKVCHKSGHVAVSFDEKKTDKAAVLTALESTGFDIAGEQLSIPVSGMNCGKCSTKLTTALNAIDGCSVGSVCHKSGHATVTIDPAKTSEAKIVEAITTNGYTVGKTAEVKTTTEAPVKS